MEDANVSKYISYYETNSIIDVKHSLYKEGLNEIIKRNTYTIILPHDIKEELDRKRYLISAKMYKGKPSCIQMFKHIDGNSMYIGTLKSYMNVKSFKDGNICNFSKENLIYNEEK